MDASLGVQLPIFQKNGFEIRPRGDGVLSRTFYDVLHVEKKSGTSTHCRSFATRKKRGTRGTERYF